MKEKLTILLIKIGLFFANCDGYNDPREKKFISNFLKSLELNKILNPQSYDKEVIDNIKYDDINSIIGEMNDFVSQLKDDEKQPFVSMIDVYIQGIIKADNIIDPNEASYYKKWKDNVKL